MKTIFVHNATILDCAVLFPGLGPQGRSWYVDVLWKGDVTGEGVLVDFAEAKKSAKAVIDNEFDHRLFVSTECLTDESLSSRRVLIVGAERSNVFALNIYAQGIVCVSGSAIDLLQNGNCSGLEEFLSRAVLAASPKNVRDVIVRLRNTEAARTNYFSYTHSLRCHNGNCQRFHGHSNVIEVIRDGVVDEAFSRQAAQFLSGKYLVSQSYVCDDPVAEGFLPVLKAIDIAGGKREHHAYVTYIGSQGDVFLAIPKSTLLTTPDESTIESIADFVKNALFADDTVQVIAYEGLQKGAFSS